MHTEEALPSKRHYSCASNVINVSKLLAEDRIMLPVHVMDR